MCAPATLQALVPFEVGQLLSEAFESVRRVEDLELASGACLVRVARRFIEVWKDQVKGPRTVAQKVRARDGRCQTPGCSGPAEHSHHVEFRSHGGGDELENQVGLCPFHHLRCIHGGWLRVTGRAPDALTWILRGRIWTGPRG